MLLTELKDQASAPTLARKLGDTAHVSGLAIRLARLSGAGDRLPEWLLKVAVERGAKHYQRNFDPSLPPDNPSIPDAEIGIALCLNQLPYQLDNLRAAAQFLSSPRVDALPHWSRLVSHTGISKHGGPPETDWLCRHE